MAEMVILCCAGVTSLFQQLSKHWCAIFYPSLSLSSLTLPSHLTVCGIKIKRKLIEGLGTSDKISHIEMMEGFISYKLNFDLMITVIK
jgi:hypothetical protein